jgi:hypothetical protein
MREYESLFYGDCSKNGYKISYLLLSRKIQHTFIYADDKFSFSIKTARLLREFIGFDEIFSYINRYGYIFDFPEINNWNS